MARQLPSQMAGCVRVEGDSVRFDASGCRIDARRLLDLAKAVERQPLPLPDETLAEIEAALIEASEEFIPEWEDIEDQGTGGRGTAGELVSELRGRLEACHSALLSALADSCQMTGQHARAIPYLKQGLARFPNDDEIALRLCDAYQRSGRPRTAARLKEQYGLRKAS
jgi:DNA-binding SARP family transcriptional activator